MKIYDYDSYLDFNWEDHGYHILKDILPEITECVYMESKFCFEMTFGNMGYYQKENTVDLRFAMCAYIEKIFGLNREYYNYQLVNKLIDKDDKTFLKYVACYPENLTDTLLVNMTYYTEDIIHIILLVLNSKMITQLRSFINKLKSINVD